MQFSMERWSLWGSACGLFDEPMPLILQQKICRNDRALTAQKTHCDKPSPVRRVMLHLRACYVSKAAILTNPVLLVPVENRSPV